MCTFNGSKVTSVKFLFEWWIARHVGTFMKVGGQMRRCECDAED